MELRREHFVGGKSIKQLARSTGLSRNTIRRALRSDAPPSYRRAPRAGVLDPFNGVLGGAGVVGIPGADGGHGVER